MLLRKDARGDVPQQPTVHEEVQQAEAGVLTLQRSLPTVFVANDWPTSLVLLRLRYCLRGGSQAPPPPAGSAAAGHASAVLQLQSLLSERLAGAAAAFCIHNLAYQGLFSAAAFPRLRLPATALPALCTSVDWHAVLHSGHGSNLEGGLAAMDPPAEQRGTQQQLEQPQERAGGPLPPDSYLSPTMAAATPPAPVAHGGDHRRWRWMRKLRQQGTGGDGGAEGVAEEELEEQQEPAHPVCESGRISFMQGALLAADALVTVRCPCGGRARQAWSVLDRASPLVAGWRLPPFCHDVCSSSWCCRTPWALVGEPWLRR